MNELGLYSQRPASLWHDNPALVHLLGITPVLAVSDSTVQAAALGLMLVMVGVSAALCLFAIGASIPVQHGFFWYGIALAACTSVMAWLLQAFFPLLYQELGFYCYLGACNFALLLKMDAYRAASHWRMVLTDSLRLGTSLLLAVLLLALVREWLLGGTLFHGWQMLVPGTTTEPAANHPGRDGWFPFAALSPGAFLLLGLLIALLRKTGSQHRTPLQHRATGPVQRARVT